MLGSLKGIPLRIFALILGILVVGLGVYLSFIQSAGYEKATATIISIEEDPNYIPDTQTENDKQYVVTVKYTVDGKDYTRVLDSYSSSYEVGKEVEVRYNPKDPGTVHSSPVFGYVFMAIGGVIVIIAIIWTVLEKTSAKRLKQSGGETVYMPSVKGKKRTLYFLTDLGTAKYGHRIEDSSRTVLYEAKMTKFTLTTPFCFDFIDHKNNITTPHLIGHEEETEWNTLLIDNHYTFTLDGEDIWKHLNRNGISVRTKITKKKTPTPVFTIFRDGLEIADMEATSQYVHEEDAEEHKEAAMVPVRGFYRITTREINLDLLFVTILAFARSGAGDDKGGRIGMVKGTIKD